MRFWRSPVFYTVLSAVGALFLLAYPIYVIRPFRQQGARELQVALAITRYRFVPEVLLAIMATAFAVLCWRSRVRIWLRLLAAACALVAIAGPFLSRLNIYELMFHPLDRATFSPASKARLDANEEVIAVRIGTQARAYPVRSMSYHHIVNDVLAGEPIVAAY